MGAPSGNQFWKLRSKHGRNKLFSDPEILWEAACEYFQWCDDHPWQKNEAVKAGPNFGELVHIPTARPYTIQGLCIYLGCDENTIERYASEKNYNDFWAITRNIKRIIYNQKFEGAAVGAFNAVIISRDLGLTDKTDITSKGESILPIMGVKIVKDDTDEPITPKTG